MNHDIPLGRLRGIRVGMSWSVLLIAGFYVYILATYQFPNEAFDSTTAAYWIAGIVGALVFFLSLLVHEMSHALVARATGIEVRGITLWLLGGFAELGSEPDSPGKQFTIAVVGPISNLLLAAVFWLAHGLVATNPDPFAMNTGTSGLIAVVLGWLAFVNLLLGVFNLLPAAPLDGGQLFGAGVWAASGNRTVSRRWSAYAGIVLGSAGVAYGLVTMNSQGTLNGIWLMIIGWWIAGIAWSEIRRLDAERNLAPVAVGDIMGPEPPMLPAQTTIDAALGRAPDRSRPPGVLRTGTRWPDRRRPHVIPDPTLRCHESGDRPARPARVPHRAGALRHTRDERARSRPHHRRRPDQGRPGAPS